MPIYFGSRLIKEARVGTQLYDGYVGSQMVHGKARLPAFTYTGNYEQHPASYYGLSGDYTVIALLTSGVLTFSKNVDADVFLVGGGASGVSSESNGYGAGGGGGGYTKTVAMTFDTTPINATIGAGGRSTRWSGYNNAGESTTIGNETVSGGLRNTVKYTASNGGSGGGSGGAYQSDAGSGGYNGSDGYVNTSQYSKPAGVGQHTTTAAFGENGAKLFAAGGGGGACEYTAVIGEGGVGGGGTGGKAGQPPTNGGDNTGSGGGGTYGSNTYAQDSGQGGSGIILIRPAQ